MTSTMERLCTDDELACARKVLDRFSKPKSDEEVFYHVCFAVLAPQAQHEGISEAVRLLKERDFYVEDAMHGDLVPITRHVRFKNVKATRLMLVKSGFHDILDVIRFGGMTDVTKRNAIAARVSGIGLKAASHLLRNLGAKDLAILDVHILRFLGDERRSVQREPEYLALEQKFREKAVEQGMSVAELDAILWRRGANIPWEDFKY